MPLTWCDKLASTPAIGFGLDSHLLPSASILAALAPVFNKWVDGEKINFTMNKLDAFGFEITSNDGFQYGVDHSRIFIEFIHRMRMKVVSAGPPVAELTSTPLPYSTLFSEISRRLIEATMLLPGLENRKVTRIGVVSTTALDDAVMPPGIARLVKYMSRPWQGNLQQYHFELVSELRKGSGTLDKCIHTLRKPDDPDQPTTVRFDWQRSLDPSRAVHADILRDLLRGAETAAMAYFEELAEGNRFDEDILRSAT
jgi:hypothetical protein